MSGHTNLYVSVEAKNRIHELKRKYRFHSNTEVLEALFLVFEDVERKIGEGEMMKRIFELQRGKETDAPATSTSATSNSSADSREGAGGKKIRL